MNLLLKRSLLFTFFYLIVFYSKAQIPVKEPDPEKVSAFVGVHVVPMDREHIIENQTVLIRGGKIIEIGDVDKVEIPEDAAVINLKGVFMMPGLVDMHAHLPTGEPNDVKLHDYLELNVIRGVTTIRSMRGDPQQLKWRDSIARHQLLGPRLFLASPVLPAEINFKEGVALLDQYQKEKYDFVKYLNPLRPSLYDSLMEAARQKGIRVAGHCPEGGIQAAIKAKQASIEHLEPFLDEYKSDSVKFMQDIRDMAFNGIYACPDMQYYYISWNQLWLSQMQIKPGVNALPAELVKTWINDYQKMYAMETKDKKDKPAYLKKKDKRRVDLETAMKMLKLMSEEGVPLLTSAGDGAFIVPGFSLLDECRNFNDAGLSPYQTLRAATVNGASFFGETSSWGTLGAGKRADLLFLEENPLLNIENLDKIKGVMLNGTWFPKEELDRMQAELVARNQAPQ
jgi:imidazolonepropionase-like amidohydrolase